MPKKCFVANCESPSSIKFNVPSKSRNKYLDLCSKIKYSTKTNLYICSNHFDINRDCYFNGITGKFKLISGVFPSIGILKRRSNSEDEERANKIQKTFDSGFLDVSDGSMMQIEEIEQCHSDNRNEEFENNDGDQAVERVDEDYYKNSDEGDDEGDEGDDEGDEDFYESDDEEDDCEDDEGDEDFHESDDEEDDCEEEECIPEVDFQSCKSIGEYTMKLIETYPEFYVGILKENLFFIDLLVEGTGISKRDVYIVLLKIRRNESLASIGHRFNLTQSRISQIISENIEKISTNISTFIYNAEPEKIEENVPINFQNRFKKTTHIIDCFEIPIEKPSNAMEQALSWSNYYSDNTAKVLVSATPDGLINFISKAYGGRISDEKIVNVSKFIENVKPGSSIMADRGFKGCEKLFEKGKFIRPPSVIDKKNFSRNIAVEAKMIASLRINIERTIRKLRGYKIISKYSQIPAKYRKYINYFVTISAGLSNMLRPLNNEN